VAGADIQELADLHPEAFPVVLYGASSASRPPARLSCFSRLILQAQDAALVKNSSLPFF
jgi:hypothetical protein